MIDIKYDNEWDICILISSFISLYEYILQGYKQLKSRKIPCEKVILNTYKSIITDGKLNENN